MRTTLMVWGLSAAMTVASAAAGPRANIEDQPLRAIVSPHVGWAPAVVRIQAIVRPADENRGIVFILDSDNYYRRSVVPIDGDADARVHFAEFRSVPAGVLQVTVALVDRRGGTRVTVQDVIQIME